MSDIKFPNGFIDSISTAAEFNTQAFTAAHAMSVPVSVRLHPTKNIFDFSLKEKVPWCENAFYLDERPVFTLDPLFHAGSYYVQEASSMFLDYVLQQCCDVQQPLKILDLCAAPGGKSTHIASTISEDSLLVSNELIKQRVQVLKENMLKWGNANTIITHNDAQHFGALQQYFDVIIVDAPCSGSGLFRKDKDAMQRWNTEAVLMCAQRQEKIVHDVLPALKENGILIYSTCSYSLEEDENIVDHCKVNYNMIPLEISMDPEWNIVLSETIHGGIGYRFYPDKIKGEGFFISVLRNTKAIPSTNNFRHKEVSLSIVTAHEKQIISNWVHDLTAKDLFKINNKIIAVPKGFLYDVQLLANKLLVLQSGIEIGEIKGKDFIPAHALALSNYLHTDVLRYDLDKETALQYLRKQEITLPGERLGFAIVCYKNMPLGWIKKMPNRINNYYPSEYRIRM